MNACYIISAVPMTELPFMPREGDFIIAADAGLLNCEKFGLKPDLILGDFDSMARPEARKTEVYPVEKDDTDTMLAIKRGLELGYREFRIFGGLGGARPDHSIANLQGLCYLAERGARGFLYGERYTFTAIRDGTLRIEQPFYDAILSVFCFGSDAEGVTISGTKYQVENAVLTAGFPLGVSNHILQREAAVTVKKGTLVIGWERMPEDGAQP